MRMINVLKAQRLQVRLGIVAFFMSLFGIVLGTQSTQAYSYNNYTVSDFAVTNSSTTAGASTNFTATFTLPFALSTSGYISFSAPYMYSYKGGTYSSEYVTINSISSTQLSSSYSYSSYASFTPSSSLAAGTKITITGTATNPATLEGAGTFSVYGSEYTSDNYNYFYASTSVLYGDPDLTVSIKDSNGTTAIQNVSVSLSYYNYSTTTYEYEYQYCYTNSSGQCQFAGLTSGRTYNVYFYYDGSATTADPPSSTTLTYSGGDQTASYSFVSANVTTHWKDKNGTAVNNAYWYFYKTDYTDYNLDYVYRYGYTDSTGLISGAANKDGNYTLYVADSNWNYYSFDFKVTNGVVSGLSDPIKQPSPELSGYVYAGGVGVENVYLYAYNDNWSSYKYDYTDSTGYFEMAFGKTDTYTVYVSYGLPDGYFAPDAVEVSITSGVAGSPLTINLEAPTKTISGTVTMKGDSSARITAGTPVTDAYVYGYQSGGSWQYFSTTTDEDGGFEKEVPGGTWNIYVYPNTWPAEWAYTGEALIAQFSSDDTQETATFNIQVLPYNSTITGKVVYPNGTTVGANDVYVYASGGENNSVYSYAYTDADGSFSINTTAGVFNLYMYFYSSSGAGNYSAPTIDSQTVGSGETIDLGTLELVEKTSHIQGAVSISDSGEGVEDVSVYAYKEDGTWDYGYTTSGTGGTYDLLVGPGNWAVYVYVYNITTSTGESVIYPGGSLSVTVADGETVTGNDFLLHVADSTLNFIVQDSSGANLDDEYGWVSVYEDSGGTYGWYSQGCYLVGNCTVDVASDVAYSVSFYSYSNWWASSDDTTYTYSYMTVDGAQADTVTTTDAETQDVILVMAQNDVTVSGKFLDQNDKEVEIYGDVYATNDNGGYAYAYVDNESSYTLMLSEGTWNLNYWTWGGSYSSYYDTEGREITVESGDEKTVNFSVLNNDATISGKVIDPDGNAVEKGFVKVSTSYGTQDTDTEDLYGLIEQTTYTGAEGKFSIELPSGDYYVTAAYEDYLDPQPVLVSADVEGGAENLVLQFVEADATISGVVTEGGLGITVNNRRSVAVGDIVDGAWVYAYSQEGASIETETDENGAFTIPVTAGNWVIGAIKTSNNVGYFSDATAVTVDEAAETQNLTTENTISIPETQTRQFAPSEPQVITIDNPDTGEIALTVNIPAYAITADETVTQVTVKVAPTLEMSYEAGAQPWKIGYELTATDQDGNPIDNFAGNVTLEFTYEDDDLTEAGVTDGDLTIGYHEGEGWENLSSVVCDTDVNTCTVTCDHFSQFSILASQSVLTADEETSNGGDGDGDGDGGVDLDVESSVLTAPENLKASERYAKKVQFTWDRVDSAASYQLKIELKKSGKEVKNVNIEKRKKLVNSGLKSNSKYVASVRSNGSNGSKSSWSSGVVFRTKPLPPKKLRVIEKTSSTATVQWKKPVGKILNYSFKAYKGEDTAIELAKKKTKKTELIISGLEPETKYSFRVKARFDSENVSQFTKRLYFTTLAD